MKLINVGTYASTLIIGSDEVRPVVGDHRAYYIVYVVRQYFIERFLGQLDKLPITYQENYGFEAK